MDRDSLLELITTEDVIEILTDLGSDSPITDRKGALYFTTVCHCGDSKKLRYYPKEKFFQCYTTCGNLSLYDVISGALQCEFSEAFLYVCKFKGVTSGIEKKKGFQRKNETLEDLEILASHNPPSRITSKTISKLPPYQETVLEAFPLLLTASWKEEGITEEVANHFGIRFCFSQIKAVIPHRDIEGNLIGVRGRSFLEADVEKGKKYMPMTIQKLTYRYPTGLSLYGIYENAENIRRFKKVIVFESEKSVLKYGSFFGQQNNIAVATMGMNFTSYHATVLLSLGVEEIIIAYDKQYLLDYIEVDKKTLSTDREVRKKHLEYVKYIQNLIKIGNMLLNYVNMSIIACWDDRLDYKDAPIDKGKDMFIELSEERYLLEDTEELKELITDEN